MRTQPLVLLADDNADFKEIISAKLVAAGFEIAEASDGAEAIARAKALKPDLIVMDIDMPHVNGTEAVLEIKNSPETKDVQIVFFSSMDHPWPGIVEEKDAFAKTLGAVTFLKKSDDLDKVVATIKALVAAKAAPPAA